MSCRDGPGDLTLSGCPLPREGWGEGWGETGCLESIRGVSLTGQTHVSRLGSECS